MGSGVLWKIFVTQHSPPLHQEMQLEIVLCKEAFIKFAQKRHQVLWAQSHLRWTKKNYVNESTFQLVFGKNGRRILRAKDEKDHPDCYRRKVQNPASMMIWGCMSAHGMGDLHISEGTIDAATYVGILERHTLPSR